MLKPQSKNLLRKIFLSVVIFLVANFFSQWLMAATQDRQFSKWRPDNTLVDVYYLDIGQGDATLIRTPIGANILIDGGPDLSVLYQLGKSLPWYEKKIDLMILTHPDQDHMLGLVDIIRRYQVEQLVISGIVDDTPAYQFFLDVLTEQKVTVTVGQAGDSYEFGEVTARILYPIQSLAGRVVEDSNTSSLVTQVDYGETSLLFTGDLPKANEIELVATGVDLRSQVVKAGHHGSKNSSSLEFLQAVDPDFVVISAGRDNRYGHPHRRVLSNITKVGAQVLRTDLSGTIHLQLDGISVVRQ